MDGCGDKLCDRSIGQSRVGDGLVVIGIASRVGGMIDGWIFRLVNWLVPWLIDRFDGRRHVGLGGRAVTATCGRVLLMCGRIERVSGAERKGGVGNRIRLVYISNRRGKYLIVLLGII